MAKRGRPPLPGDERHDRLLIVRLTNRELAALRQRAGEAGTTMSAIVRDAINGQGHEARCTRPEARARICQVQRGISSRTVDEIRDTEEGAGDGA